MCDKCKKTFKKKGNLIQIRPLGATWKNAPWKRYDLCNTCLKGLDNYINKKKIDIGD